MDFGQLAQIIVKEVGGKENIENLTHCATRLRFTIKNKENVSKENLKNTKGVLGVVEQGGLHQVIIGNDVAKVYGEIAKILNSTGENSQAENKSEENVNKTKEKRKITEIIFEFVSAVFTPILPAIIGAGLIKSILAFAVLLGMDSKSNTYYFMNFIGDAPLYFLPIMITFTASKKIGCNQFLALSIAGAMLHPSYTALITDAFNINFTTFLGAPVTLATYGGSVIPVIFMVILLKYVETMLDNIIPKMFRFFFKPVLAILIVAFITFTVLGPLGFVIGVGISTMLNTIDTHVSWLVPTIIGGLFPLMVTAGMHYGLVPFMIQSLSARGYETIAGPGNLPSNIAQGAAALAVAMKTKNTEQKQSAFTTGITALLGITEPALFSVTLKYKKVLTSVMIGGMFGGLYAGITGVKAFSFSSPGLLSLVAFVGPDGWSNLINAIISMVISFIITFILVFVWGSQDLEK